MKNKETNDQDIENLVNWFYQYPIQKEKRLKQEEEELNKHILKGRRKSLYIIGICWLLGAFWFHTLLNM